MKASYKEVYIYTKKQGSKGHEGSVGGVLENQGL